MSEKKSEQLGMSYGKAGNILRKNIIFQLAHKANMGNCHQCGELIEEIDNFSIEHKTPWLDSETPADLFFDFNNIAFSHTTCNVGARRQGVKQNAHGFRGIRFMKSHEGKQRTKPWSAEIKFNKKKISLGCYATPEEAAAAYDRASLQYYGSEAITNKSLGLL